EAQQNNPHSLLWWMKRLIALQRRSLAFGRGRLEFVHVGKPKVLAFVRRYRDETILVGGNLSRFVQHAELGLGPFQGMVPTEMLGRHRFPAVGTHPYPLTLGSYAFYWFGLEPEQAVLVGHAQEDEQPALEITGSWEAIFQDPAREA